MLKKEVVWREILDQAIENDQYFFQQKKLAKQFNFSLSTIFNALKVPKNIGAIETSGKGFKLLNKEKLLLLWATQRKIKKEIIYQTFASGPVTQIEGKMSDQISWGAFSAYKYRFNDIPSEYDKICVYLEEKELESFKKRFPFKKGPQNLIVFKKDSYWDWKKKKISLAQIFVDIWNFPDWYTKDFLKKLSIKIKL